MAGHRERTESAFGPGKQEEDGVGQAVAPAAVLPDALIQKDAILGRMIPGRPGEALRRIWGASGVDDSQGRERSVEARIAAAPQRFETV